MHCGYVSFQGRFITVSFVAALILPLVVRPALLLSIFDSTFRQTASITSVAVIIVAPASFPLLPSCPFNAALVINIIVISTSTIISITRMLCAGVRAREVLCLEMHGLDVNLQSRRAGKAIIKHANTCSHVQLSA